MTGVILQSLNIEVLGQKGYGMIEKGMVLANLGMALRHDKGAGGNFKTPDHNHQMCRLTSVFTDYIHAVYI